MRYGTGGRAFGHWRKFQRVVRLVTKRLKSPRGEVVPLPIGEVAGKDPVQWIGKADTKVKEGSFSNLLETANLAQSTTHQMKVARPKRDPSLLLSASCQKPKYF